MNKDIVALVEEIKVQQEKFERAQSEIQDAIDRTNVSEYDIPRFLNLINDGLMFGVMSGQQEVNKFADTQRATLAVFSELIQGIRSSKLSISSYFKSVDLERLVPVLAKSGYYNMDDIKCDDTKEWSEILGVVENGLKAMGKKQKLNMKERKFLKKYCLKLCIKISGKNCSKITLASVKNILQIIVNEYTK